MSSLDLTSQSEINTRFKEIIKKGEDKSNEYKKTCKYGLDCPVPPISRMTTR